MLAATVVPLVLVAAATCELTFDEPSTHPM